MWSGRQFRGIYIILTAGLMLSASSAQSRVALTRKDPPYPADNLHSGPAWFIDVTESTGLRVKNVNGRVNSKKYIIETTGSGVAIFDYDNDGWPDIFLVNGTTLDAERASAGVRCCSPRSCGVAVWATGFVPDYRQWSAAFIQLGPTARSKAGGGSPMESRFSFWFREVQALCCR